MFSTQRGRRDSDEFFAAGRRSTVLPCSARSAVGIVDDLSVVDELMPTNHLSLSTRSALPGLELAPLDDG